VSAPHSPRGPERFPLRRHGREIVLLEDGIRHPRSLLFGGTVFTPYRDITHLAPGLRQIRIGTRRGVVILPAGIFQSPEEGLRLVRELLARVAAGEDGSAQLARMAAVEERYRHPHPVRVTRLLLLLCILVYGAQWWLGLGVEEVGMFSSTLAAAEPWRVVTGNFLHATWFPLHLLLNGIAILAFGSLVERLLGAAATAFVMALSGLGAMAAAWIAGLEAVVGASGIAMGLVGALIWLELTSPEALPAAWRLPRRLFIGLVVAETLVMAPVAWVATSAHVGGLVGGVLATAWTAGAPLAGRPRPRWLVVANALLLLVVSASFSAAAFEWQRSQEEPARRARRLVALPDTSPLLLNNVAWLIATSDAPSESDLGVALDLAERAVEATEHEDPNVLDTLAEVLFQVGRRPEALAAIDEAIRLAPQESYFREQRRRFTGERAPDDRPAPPGPLDGLLPESVPREEPGIRV
jgi:membrane associated rhomboid family serine protease